MKIREFVKGLLINTRYSLKRFPITLVVSFLLVIFLIVLNESIGENRNLLIRISMIMGLALPVSIFVQLANEVYLETLRSKTFGYLAGGVFLLLYYLLFLDNLNTIDYARYIGTVILFILGCTYIQRLKNDENYEKYIITISNGAFITGIYSVVLYLGVAFIILTLEQLFDIIFTFSIYYYLFLVVLFIFGVTMFLSKYPKHNFKDSIYPKALKVLLLYIVIPLISIYTAILYAYFIKIVVTWQWPKSLVSHLVIWYSTISTFVIFFIIPLLDRNKIAKGFRNLFPIFNIPILIMMFISIGQRIMQYGFTENRYYILLLGLWIVLIMLHYIINRPRTNTFIMVSLSVFILISVFGPLSSFNVSIRSQNNRLNELLYKNNIINNGELMPNENVSKKDQQEISNILAYFNNNHDLSNVEFLPNGYDLSKMEEKFGFKFDPYLIQEYNSFYYEHNWSEPVDVRDYDYYLFINSWHNNRVNVLDLEIHYDDSESILNISRDDKSIQIDIKKHVMEIHDELKAKKEYSSEDMTVLITGEVYNFKLVFNNISGNEVTNGDDIDLSGVEFIILLDYNN